MKIYDFSDSNLCYGEIVDVLQTGANDIYKIVDENEKEKFIPVIEDVVIIKDFKNNKIYIKLLEGLFDV